MKIINPQHAQYHHLASGKFSKIPHSLVWLEHWMCQRETELPIFFKGIKVYALDVARPRTNASERP